MYLCMHKLYKNKIHVFLSYNVGNSIPKEWVKGWDTNWNQRLNLIIFKILR